MKFIIIMSKLINGKTYVSKEHLLISKYLSNTYFLYLEPSKKIDNLVMILCNHNMWFHFFVKYIRDVRISLSVLTISRFSKNHFYFEKGNHVLIRKQFVTTKGVLKWSPTKFLIVGRPSLRSIAKCSNKKK